MPVGCCSFPSGLDSLSSHSDHVYLVVVAGYVGGETLKSLGDAVLVPKRGRSWKYTCGGHCCANGGRSRESRYLCPGRDWHLTGILVSEKQEKELAREVTEPLPEYWFYKGAGCAEVRSQSSLFLCLFFIQNVELTNAYIFNCEDPKLLFLKIDVHFTLEVLILCRQILTFFFSCV